MSITSYAIANLEPIRAALAKATNPTELKKIRDQAQAIVGYLKQKDDSYEVQLQAGLLKIEAERRLGELLREQVNHSGGGNRKSVSSGTTPIMDLPDGISRDQSSAWQKIAAIPEPQFRQAMQTIQDERLDPTTAHFVKMGKIYLRDQQKAEKRAEQVQAVDASSNGHGVRGSRPRDTWEIRQGDVLDMLQGISTRCIDLAFADPPYNIGVDYGFGSSRDSLPDEEYHGWCHAWMEECFRVLKRDGSLWVLINDEHAAQFKLLLEGMGFTVRRWIKWWESFGVNCSNNFNRTSRHLFYCIKNPKKFIFNADAVKRPSDRQTKYNDPRADPDGKIWDDVWGINPEIPRLNASTHERELGFPTQLPLRLLLPIVGSTSAVGDLVLDPFSGSGTTGEAALRLGRRYLGIELNADYAQRSQERLAIVLQEVSNHG